jgi:hypothetical protein
MSLLSHHRYLALCVCIACGSSTSSSLPARPDTPAAAPVSASPLCDAVASAIAALPDFKSIERGEPRKRGDVWVFDTRIALPGMKNVVNHYDDGRAQWNIIWPKGAQFDPVATDLESCSALAGRTPVDATQAVMEGHDEHTLSWRGHQFVELSIAFEDLELTVEAKGALPSQPAGAAPQGDCAARVADLAGWIKSADFDPMPHPMPANVELATATADQRPYLKPAYTPTFVIVSPSAITIEGTAIWTSGQPLGPVRKLLRTRIDDFRKLRRDRLELTLAIARDARWDQVVTTMDAIVGAGSTVVLAFESPRALPPKPAASELANRLGSAHADPALLAKESERLFQPCPAATDLLAHSSTSSQSADPSRRVRTYLELAQQLPAAIEHCGCAPSPEDVRTWLWHAVWSGETPGVRSVSIHAHESTGFEGVVVQFPAAQTWDLAAPAVIKTAGLQYGQTKSVRLQLAP